MKIIRWILVFQVTWNSIPNVNCFPLESFMKITLKDMDSYQVTTFISESLTKNLTHQEISSIQEFPSNLYRLRSINDENNTLLPNETNVVDSSLMILYTDELNDTKILIDLVVWLIPLNPRPKCLILSSDQTSDSTNKTEEILRYAWKNKMLDVTIVEVNADKSVSKVLNYNPFFKSFNEGEFKSNLKVFPNKLTNLNNHTIKLAPLFASGDILDHWPNRSMPRYIIPVAREEYLTKFILKQMNSYPKVVKGTDIQNFSNQDYIFDWKGKHIWFENTDVVVFGYRYVAADSLHKALMSSAENDGRCVLILVPRLYRSHFNVPYKILLIIITMSGVTFSLAYAIKFLKITKDFHGVFDVVCILLGQSLTNLPQKITSRMIYMTIIVFYVYISNKFYDGILELQLGQEEIEFTSFEDLDESGLPVGGDFESWYLYDSAYSPALLSLKKKTTKMPNCFEKLKETKKFICFVRKSFLDYILTVEEKENLQSFAKILEFPFFTDDDFFRFEYASPYINMFAKINRWILESGIMEIEYLKNHISLDNKVTVKPLDDGIKILNPLILILTSGYAIAILCFVAEYSYAFLRKVCHHFFPSQFDEN